MSAIDSSCDQTCSRATLRAIRLPSVTLMALMLSVAHAQVQMPMSAPKSGIDAASVPGAHAATAISDADMARAARQQPHITAADEARAARRFAAPSDDELARVPIPGPINVDALPAPASTLQGGASSVNLSDVARGYEAAQAALRRTSPKIGWAGFDAAMPSLVIFISFAMPMPTLERLATQADAVGATLVLRGLIDGSLRETAQRCQTLIGKQHVVIQIDPQSFERFAVSQTPTFVLVKAGRNATAPSGQAVENAGGYVSVHGDVSIDYALRVIAARAPDFEHDARLLLARLPAGRP